MAKKKSISTYSIRDMKLAEDGLNKILSMDVPIDVAYSMSKLSKVVREELALAEDMRRKLVSKYGKVNDDGTISVPPGTKEWELFEKDYNRVLDKEVEIEYSPLGVEELGGDVRLSADEMAGLIDKFVTV